MLKVVKMCFDDFLELLLNSFFEFSIKLSKSRYLVLFKIQQHISKQIL